MKLVRFRLIFFCGFLFLTGLGHPLAAQPKYTVHDLGTLGLSSGWSSAAGINGSGQVVGSSYLGTGAHDVRAFRTAPNSSINPATDDLGGLNGSLSPFIFAAGINRPGQEVGDSN